MTEKTFTINGTEIILSGYQADGIIFMDAAHKTQEELIIIQAALEQLGCTVKLQPVMGSDGQPMCWNLNAEQLIS